MLKAKNKAMLKYYVEIKWSAIRCFNALAQRINIASPS